MVQANSTSDIEELLKLAEAKPEVKIRFEDTEVEKFILEMKITAGETKVPTYTIFYKYVLWKKKRGMLSRNAFFRQFQKHFEKTPTDDGIAYRLNPDQFDLTTDGYFKARNQLRRERYDRKKKNKKKQSKEHQPKP